MLIGTDWQVKADRWNFTVYKRCVVRKGGYRWREMAYFNTLEDVFKYLYDQEVSTTELKDLQTVLDKQDEVYKLIDKLAAGSVKV
jgi:hypothetical protein